MDTLSNAEKSQSLLEAKRLGDGRLDRNRKRNMLLFSSWWTHNLSISWQSCFTQKLNFKLSLIVVDQECPGCPLSALVTNPSSLPPPSLPPLTYWTQTCTDHECPGCPKSLFELSSVFPPLTSLPSTPPCPWLLVYHLAPYIHLLDVGSVKAGWLLVLLGTKGLHIEERDKDGKILAEWNGGAGGGAWSSDFQLSAF